MFSLDGPYSPSAAKKFCFGRPLNYTPGEGARMSWGVGGGAKFLWHRSRQNCSRRTATACTSGLTENVHFARPLHARSRQNCSPLRTTARFSYLEYVSSKVWEIFFTHAHAWLWLRWYDLELLSIRWNFARLFDWYSYIMLSDINGIF